jgi:hypothetical protein
VVCTSNWNGVENMGWGVIYSALAIFCLYHLKMAYSRPEKHNTNNDTLRVDIFFIISNLVAAGWLLAVAYGNLTVSLVLLGIQLFLVLIIHHRLGIYKRDRRIRTNLCTQMPLSLYAGWLFMTVMAGIGQYIGLSGILQTIIFIAAIAFISLLIIFIRNNIFFGLVVIAGLYGFITKIELYGSGSYDIILATWISIGTLAIASFIKLMIDFRIKERSGLFQRAAFH